MIKLNKTNTTNYFIIKNNKEAIKNIFYNRIKEYILNNCDLISLVRDINGYNGSLGSYEYWENDEEFFETFYYNNPMEVARACCYGNYNFIDDFVQIDAYGNLSSSNKWEIESELQDIIEEITDCVIDIYIHLYLENELVELIELYENI